MFLEWRAWWRSSQMWTLNSSHSAKGSDGEQSQRIMTNRFLSWWPLAIWVASWRHCLHSLSSSSKPHARHAWWKVGSGLPPSTQHCYNFSYFVMFTSLFLEVSHGAATLTHFSLTHIAATLLTHSTAGVLTYSIAILIVLSHWCSIYSGQSCQLFFS